MILTSQMIKNFMAIVVLYFFNKVLFLKIGYNFDNCKVCRGSVIALEN